MATMLADFEDERFHPAATIFPAMSDDEMAALIADIERNGLLEPIWTYQGQIIDGRHRFQACEALDIVPAYREYAGPESAIYVFVVALNLKRRHLTEAQKATVGVELLSRYEDDAKRRQGARRDLNIPENFPECSQSDESRARAADDVGTNPHYISDAKRIKDTMPQVYELMREGELNVPAAREVERIPEPEIREAVVDALIAGDLTRHTTEIKRRANDLRREAKREANRTIVAVAPAIETLATAGERFSCIVIDPPWDWGDEGDVDQFGRARPDYATMSIDEIAGLPMPDLSQHDAHLYLWITNRSLPKGFALLEKWGYRYVTMLTWVKPHFGMGNYFRGQTEHVLFGVRGSLPLLRSDVGTCFTADRGDNGHSSKPASFYELVESCSPGPWLEMFSRADRRGWKRWGE